MEFRYRARDSRGRVVEGILEATNQQDAVATLYAQHFHVTDIRPVPQRESPPLLQRLFIRPRPRDLAVWYENLYRSLHAGINLHEALLLLAEEAETRILRKVSSQLADGVRQGKLLHREMSRHPAVFNPLYVQMIRLAENAGTLEPTLQQIVDYLNYIDEIDHMIRRATIYPKIIVFVGILAAGIVPNAFALVRGDYSGVLRQVVTSWAYIGVAAVGIIAVWRLISPARAFRWIWDTLKWNLPWVSSTIRRISFARFARALSALTRSGVPIVSGMELAARASGNIVLERDVMSIVPALRGGATLSESLAKNVQMPRSARNMLAVGERTGQMNDALDNLAQYYERDSRTGLNQMAVVLGVVVYLAVGVWVAIFVARFYLGYFEAAFKYGESFMP